MKAIFVIAIVVAASALRILYLGDLARGFKSQQSVASKIEDALGFFTPGHFGGTQPIYPSDWANAGTAQGKGNYFGSSFALIYIASALLFLAIIFDGILF
jgi:hypothetical protein